MIPFLESNHVTGSEGTNSLSDSNSEIVTILEFKPFGFLIMLAILIMVIIFQTDSSYEIRTRNLRKIHKKKFLRSAQYFDS